MKKKLLVGLIITIYIFLWPIELSRAYGDDLVIQDDGNILYVITTSDVLGASTDITKSTPTTPPPPAQSLPTTPQNTIPLVPPHTDTTVNINPPVNNDKKMQVTVTTQTAAPAAPSPTPITKIVNQVVATSSNGNPVITISSQKANQLTIKQGATSVTTSLPLQIDTKNHSLNVTSNKQSTQINVLPSEALQGIVNTGIVSKQNALQTHLNLTKDSTGVNYNLTAKKQGKILGVFPVTSSVQVKLSAQSGKVSTQQGLLFNVFGGLIK